MPPKRTVQSEGTEFCIRLDLNGAERTDIESKFAEWVSKYKCTCIGCFEYPHDNYHYHFWMKMGELTKLPGLRKAFLKVFPHLVGNKSYSMTASPGDLIYICKGPLTISKGRGRPGERKPPEIVINTMNVSPDDILKAQDEWWEKYGVNGKEEKDDKRRMIRKIYDSIEDKKKAREWNIIECAMYVAHCYHLEENHPLDHFWRSVAKGLYIQLNEQRYCSRLASMSYALFKHDMDHEYDVSNFKASDYQGFLDYPTWDPIEREII